MIIWKKVIATIACCLLAAYMALYFNIFGFKKSEVPPELLKHSRSISLTKLERDKSVRFPLLKTSRLVRIATNADFPENLDIKNSYNKELYAIKVDAYDLYGNLVESRELNYFTQVRLYFDEKWGMYLPSFYLDSNNIPSDTKVTTLNFKDSQAIAEIRISRIDSNKNLESIFARVYQPASVSGIQVDSYWSNLMPSEKERLASANLYPLDLMNDEEKRNIIRHLWTLAGPAGIPGKDYFEKSLYSIVSPQGVPYDLGLLYSGNYVDNKHSLILPVTENNSLIKIDFIPAGIVYPKYTKIWIGGSNDMQQGILEAMRPDEDSSAGSQHDRGQKIKLEWRGRGIGANSVIEEDIDERSISRQYKFDAGLVTVSSDSPSYLNINKITSAGEESVLLSPASSNLIRLNPADPVKYEIIHSNDSETVFRIDVRRVSSQIFTEDEVKEFTYELLDKEGRVLSKEDVKFAQSPVKLDSVVRRGDLYISDRQRMYFIFSKDVAFLRLSGPDDLFVSAYNRLEGFQRYYIIPDDYRIAESKEESLRRTWFYKTPEDYNGIRSSGRTVQIKTQPRALSDDEYVSSGIYKWENIYPGNNNWEAEEILTKVNPLAAFRAESTESTYYQLKINQPQTIEIAGFLGREYVVPTILYSAEKQGANISISVDGREVLRTTLTGKKGGLNLPNMPIGKREIVVRADVPLTAYINQTKIDNEERFITRKAVGIGKGGLIFTFEKPDEQDRVITLAFYSSTQKDKKINIKINSKSLLLNKPLASYTVKNRGYEVKFTKESEGQFYQNRDGNLYPSEPIFIKLGADLRKGKYNIEMQVENNEGDLFATMGSLTAGLVNDNTISTEEMDED